MANMRDMVFLELKYSGDKDVKHGVPVNFMPKLAAKLAGKEYSLFSVGSAGHNCYPDRILLGTTNVRADFHKLNDDFNEAAVGLGCEDGYEPVSHFFRENPY
ncbi:MAG: hypothetical protein PHE24_05160 [Patescibacteria group bacterium]|nr:hypothetical protein [Patescibacteria group bacterium]